MYYVYLLKSKVDDKHYIGVTNDLFRRFNEHNTGKSLATKHRKPFSLVYYEAYKSSKDTVAREKKLKQFKNSYKELMKRVASSDL